MSSLVEGPPTSGAGIDTLALGTNAAGAARRWPPVFTLSPASARVTAELLLVLSLWMADTRPHTPDDWVRRGRRAAVTRP